MNQIEDKVLLAIKNIKKLNKFTNKKILITGGTGYIGSYLIRTLIKLNDLYGLNINVYGMARNKNKVESLDFSSKIHWIYASLSEPIVETEKFDYIIHTASPTDSAYFIERPVELINDTINGLNNLMKIAVNSKVESMVFLSSLEVYGICTKDISISEDDYYSINPTNVRNSYSEGKKILECLCCSYSSEYNVPVKIVRLAQSFGPGIDKSDRRVFSQFANSIINKQNIILASKGETKRSYCSITDAIIGIFTVLLNGDNGQAYNLASDNSYLSIYELAKLFSKNSVSNIIIHEQKCNKYLPTIKFEMNTNKIKNIGFKSVESIEEMVSSLIQYFRVI